MTTSPRKFIPGDGTVKEKPHDEKPTRSLSAICTTDYVCDGILGLINPCNLSLMYSNHDLRAMTSLPGDHGEASAEPEPQTRSPARGQKHWNYFHREHPPPAPPLFEIDLVEEAAREKRHIDALMKERPGTTEAYWREVHARTTVPDENLVWRSAGDELYQMESRRQSNNFVTAPTAGTTAQSHEVSHPAEAHPEQQDREHYQLHLIASDEEHPNNQHSDVDQHHGAKLIRGRTTVPTHAYDSDAITTQTGEFDCPTGWCAPAMVGQSGIHPRFQPNGLESWVNGPDGNLSESSSEYTLGRGSCSKQQDRHRTNLLEHWTSSQISQDHLEYEPERV